MDELDVKILRALISESAMAQSAVQVGESLRRISKRLGADDTTVRKRYKRFQMMGSFSNWQLFVNPRLLGYEALDLTLYVQPESAKADMMRKIKLIHGVVAMANCHGSGMKVILFYDSAESRSRTIELISRITNAESMVLTRMILPACDTKRLTETDLAIVQALAHDARKPSSIVAKELGLSTRTVRNRVDKLRREKALFTLPRLNIGGMPGIIPVYLSYSYARTEGKAQVDRAMLSHFDANLLWGGFADPDHGFVVLAAPTMSHIQAFLEWAREQEGVASAKVDIPTDLISLPDKVRELLSIERTMQQA